MNIKKKFLGTIYLSIVIFGILMSGLTYYQYKLTSDSIRSTLEQAEKLEMVAQLELAFCKVVMPANDFLIHGNENEKEIFYDLDFRVEEFFSLLKSKYYLPGTETVEKTLLFHINTQYVHVKNISKNIFDLHNPIGNVEGARLMEEMDLLVDDILKDMELFHVTIKSFLLKEFESVDASFYRYMSTIIGILIAVIIASSLYGLFLSKGIINPINKLVEGTKRLAEGDHTFRIETNSKDEIGILTASFNNMTSSLEESKKQLQDYAYNLQDKVRVRTQELDSANKDLRLAEQKSNAILKSVGDGVITIDVNSCIQYANHELLKIFDYSYEEILGQHIHILMPEKYRTSHTKSMISYLEEGHPKVLGSHLEMEGLRKDGSIFPLEMRIEETIIDERNKLFTAAIRDITVRKQTDEQIKASLREKEILIREVYHRTKNNMAIICSLLTLQSGYTKDDKVLEVFKELANRIKSMAIVHKKLYQTKDLSNISLKSYIEDLMDSLSYAYHIKPDKISLKLFTDDVSVSIDSAVPCGLVINEIITNSMKYAFPSDRKGEIRIELSKTDKGEIKLVIADDGIGLPNGFDIKKTDTLGLQLVLNLIENQLGGQVEVKSEKGVEFHIRFKEPERLKRV